jgi:hypothetical protein
MPRHGRRSWNRLIPWDRALPCRIRDRFPRPTSRAGHDPWTSDADLNAPDEDAYTDPGTGTDQALVAQRIEHLTTEWKPPSGVLTSAFVT